MIAGSASYLQSQSTVPIDVRVVLYDDTQTYTAYESTLQPSAQVIEVRKGEVPTVTVGDAFTVNGVTYIATSEPVALMNNAVWRVAVRCA